MAHITAAIGAMLICVSTVVLSFMVCAVILPPKINHTLITIHLGLFFVRANPTMLVAIPVAGFAAFHWYRSTLKRYSSQANKSPANHDGPP